jgi:hypothetical protein
VDSFTIQQWLEGEISEDPKSSALNLLLNLLFVFSLVPWYSIPKGVEINGNCKTLRVSWLVRKSGW